jgi:hypothetical protein
MEFLSDPTNYQQLMVDKDLESVRASPIFLEWHELNRPMPID